MLAARRDIRACGAGERARADVGAAVDAHADAARRLARAGAVRTLVASVSGYAPPLLLLAAAPWLLDRGLTAGELAGSALFLVGTLQPSVLTLAQLTTAVGVPLATTSARLAATTREPPRRAPHHHPHPHPARVDLAVRLVNLSDSADKFTSTTARSTPIGAGIAVRGLEFRHPGAAAPVARRLTLDVADGERLAVVGPSGSGKSTLLLLLAGLTRPDRGEIRLGGVSLAALPAADLRRLVALIPQQAYVHAGTLRENLEYLSGPVGRARLDATARRFGLGPAVHRLGGYDVPLGTVPPSAGGAGPALSAGERQLVALARVHLSPARVVLLDEATCHLDPAAEEAAERAFAERGGTLVIVAHRLGSAARADRVLLLDGPATAIGGHGDLARRSPTYATLLRHWSPALAQEGSPVPG
jgi:ATP-binding cassette subfamily C protein